MLSAFRIVCFPLLKSKTTTHIASSQADSGTTFRKNSDKKLNYTVNLNREKKKAFIFPGLREV